MYLLHDVYLFSNFSVNLLHSTCTSYLHDTLSFPHFFTSLSYFLICTSSTIFITLVNHKFCTHALHHRFNIVHFTHSFSGCNASLSNLSLYTYCSSMKTLVTISDLIKRNKELTSGRIPVRMELQIQHCNSAN